VRLIEEVSVTLPELCSSSLREGGVERVRACGLEDEPGIRISGAGLSGVSISSVIRWGSSLGSIDGSRVPDGN
jgi:hypothetical protein